MNHDIRPTVTIIMNDRGNPPGKLSDAELTSPKAAALPQVDWILSLGRRTGGNRYAEAETDRRVTP